MRSIARGSDCGRGCDERIDPSVNNAIAERPIKLGKARDSLPIPVES